jgi:hypothetical protein
MNVRIAARFRRFDGGGVRGLNASVITSWLPMAPAAVMLIGMAGIFPQLNAVVLA